MPMDFQDYLVVGIFSRVLFDGDAVLFTDE